MNQLAIPNEVSTAVRKKAMSMDWLDSKITFCGSVGGGGGGGGGAKIVKSPTTIASKRFVHNKCTGDVEPSIYGSHLIHHDVHIIVNDGCFGVGAMNHIRNTECRGWKCWLAMRLGACVFLCVNHMNYRFIMKHINEWCLCLYTYGYMPGFGSDGSTCNGKRFKL